VRPESLAYAVDERPPPGVLLILALQHMALAMALMVYVLIAAQEIGLDATKTRGLVATSVLVVGLATLIQSAPTRFGSGLLLVHIPSPIQLAAWTAVAKVGGAAQAGGALLLAALLQIGCARLMPRLRSVIPAEVIGVVVMMLGISLVPAGITRLLGMSGALHMVDASHALAGGLTLAVIVGIAVWSRGRLRLFALLIGLAVGEAASVLTGTATGLTDAGDLHVFAAPALTMPAMPLSFSILLPVLVTALLSSLDTVGAVVVQEKMNDSAWRRSDMRRVGRGVLAGGLGTLIAGVMGGFGIGVSSASIGLCSATGTTARTVGMATGAGLVAIAFLPPVIDIITATPVSVMGAISVYAGAYLMTSGMELMMSRMLDNRRIFMVGLSLSAGVSVLVFPGLAEQAPAWMHPLLVSPPTTAAILAVGLHLLFRLGTKRSGSMRLEAGAPPADVTAFLERQGALWGARREVILRASTAALETVEAIRAVTGAPVTLTAHFDEYALDLEMRYVGPPLNMSAEAVDLQKALESDHDLDRTMAVVSSLLINRLSDRTRTLKADGQAGIQLHFHH
jgi:xanthine/uracil permease